MGLERFIISFDSNPENNIRNITHPPESGVVVDFPVIEGEKLGAIKGDYCGYLRICSEQKESLGTRVDSVFLNIANIASRVKIPQHVKRFLTDGKYYDDLPDWTPESCQKFLKQLEEEFAEFEVRGLYGCRMPDRWPEEMRIPIQSIYVQSLQPGQEVKP